MTQDSQPTDKDGWPMLAKFTEACTKLRGATNRLREYNSLEARVERAICRITGFPDIKSGDLSLKHELLKELGPLFIELTGSIEAQQRLLNHKSPVTKEILEQFNDPSLPEISGNLKNRK